MMSKLPLTTLFSLILSASFLFLPSFRQAFEALPASWGTGGDEEWYATWLERRGELRAEVLQSWVRTAEERHDSRTLAFAALHLQSQTERKHLADEAVALDPQLTWVYCHLNLPSLDDHNPSIPEWASRLQSWDPANAVPYLMEAQAISLRRRKGEGSIVTRGYLDALAKEAVWRNLMSKAFAAPRYDSYITRRFELERRVLREHGLDQPAVVMYSIAGYNIPDFANVRSYADLLQEKLATQSEQAGRQEEARSYYWRVAHFGERVQSGTANEIGVERLTAASLQVKAYERLLPLLRRMGESDEAATVEFASQQARRSMATDRRDEESRPASSSFWTARMTRTFMKLAVLFATLTLLCLVYVGAQRWAHGQVEGWLGRFLTRGLDYASILLLFACLGLFITYTPFAEAFSHSINPEGVWEALGPLWFSLNSHLGSSNTARLRDPLSAYFECAAGAGLAVVAVRALFVGRETP